MKCPDCSSDLNTKETAPWAGKTGFEVTVCVFCGNLAAMSVDGGISQHVEACASCGAPVEDSSQAQAQLCVGCSASGVGSPLSDESADREEAKVQREALRLFPPLPPSRAARYFERVLDALSTAGSERPSYRLLLVADLGFKTVSLPGGTMLAGVEALCGLEDEAMLAFTLAREMAHQQSGRVYRRFRSRLHSGSLSAGLEWGISLITGGAVTFGRRYADCIREAAILGYGPAHEESADASAIGLLVRSGYDPSAGVRSLAMMESRDLANRRVLAAFLDVRPARSRRRMLAEALVASYTDSATLVRLNREVYRRAAASLMREGSLAQLSAASATPEARRAD